MEHVNGWCFRGLNKGGLWDDDLHVFCPSRYCIHSITVRFVIFYSNVFSISIAMNALSVHTSKGSVPHFARPAVFVVRFLWDS